MSVGEFPCQKRTCPECPEFPVMQDRKTAEAGKTALGPIGGGKEEKKFVIWKKKVFCRLEKQNVGWKKNLSVEKKMSNGEFPLAKTDMSGMSGIPCNATPKNGRGGENPPRAYREEKKVENLSFISWSKKKAFFETVTFVAVTPEVPGSIPEGPRFESRRDQYFT